MQRSVMFERFTDQSRKVVVLAQEEARHFNHNYIGTEHLLLGLLREDEGVAARALGSLNVTLDEVREQVESIVGYGEEGTGGQAPFTPRSKKVLELALRESLELDHDYLGPEHILLGLVGESEGVAAMVLQLLDVRQEKIRREVIRLLGPQPGTRKAQAQLRDESMPERGRDQIPSGCELHHTLRRQDDTIGRIAWSPDGRLVASPSSDAIIYIWNVDAERVAHKLEGHIGAVNSVAWSPDGQMLVSVSEDATVRLWDIETEQIIQTLEGDTYTLTLRTNQAQHRVVVKFATPQKPLEQL